MIDEKTISWPDGRMIATDGQNPAQRRAALAGGALPSSPEQALVELAEAVEILAKRQLKHEKRIRALEEAQKNDE